MRPNPISCQACVQTYLFMRARLTPYVKIFMKEADAKCTPPMHPLFHDFSDDGSSWEVEDHYIFSQDMMISPILEQGQRERQVFLPQGSGWKNADTNESFAGGVTMICAAPLDVIPIFLRDRVELPLFE